MFYQSFKMAVKAIAGNKMRSFLTILGVVIGVVAIVVLVSIGQGQQLRGREHRRHGHQPHHRQHQRPPHEPH